jgi:23S rRNA (pseudouridine1915-N3)-methyltransferase
MRIAIAAVGRLKDGPERELFQRYWGRLEGLGRQHALAPLSLTEIPESRAAAADTRCTEEAAKLSAGFAAGDVVLLDASGRQWSSEGFAAYIQSRRDSGVASMTFVIGGPDGHGPATRAKATTEFSLGRITLPHGLARVVLAEQLYRAATILAGHPYHRS